MGRRAQQAPRIPTILAAIILVIVGVAGTFLHMIPAVAGYSGQTIGIAAYILAAIVMLLGIFFRGV
ncbi:MAG: hypothetical protein ABI797_03690 [Chloroflexota bacterium]